MKKNERLPAGWEHAKINPQHWHEWGNECRGTVSTFAYDQWGDYHFTGYMPKNKAVELGLTFHNPHN